MAKLCACGCGRELPPRVGPGRPPSYLAEHAPDKRQGKRRRRADVPSAPGTVTPLTGRQREPLEPPLVTATRAELDGAGRADSPEGLIVLQLAWQISLGGGTQAGLAALIRTFHDSKARALADAGSDADVLAGIFGEGTGS